MPTPEPYDLYNYSTFWDNRNYEDKCERIALKYFFRMIPKKNSIIDIGGGFGRLATLYSSVFKKCLLVDPSNNNLELAKNRLSNLSNLSYLKGASENLPKSKFDTVMMIRVAHHIPDPAKTFKEVNRILDPDGFFILEYANKTHFLAVLRSFFLRNLSYLRNLDPIDVRSPQSIKENRIIFVNHHPKKIEELLNQGGFKIVDKLSVSNFRNPKIKKIIPEGILIFLEGLLQKPLSYIHFGPSIFLLCKKI